MLQSKNSVKIGDSPQRRAAVAARLNVNESLAALLARALVLAYAALEVPSDERLDQARGYVDQALPRIEQMRRLDLTLGEARQVSELLHELREVLTAAERRHALARAG
jgi:hypothetical protein